MTATTRTQLLGAAAGVAMGCAYSVAVVAQAFGVDQVGGLAPDPVRPVASIAARWVTATLTAAVGTAAAAAVYMVVWSPHRRHGWARYAGHRVLGAGFTCWVCTGTVHLTSRLWAWHRGDGPWLAIATTPPLWLLAAIGPICFGVAFTRAAVSYLPAQPPGPVQRSVRGPSR